MVEDPGLQRGRGKRYGNISPITQFPTHTIKVSEELVLTDNTGLHLGAGPYMLIYSRATEEHDVKSEWPSTFKVYRKHM